MKPRILLIGLSLVCLAAALRAGMNQDSAARTDPPPTIKFPNAPSPSGSLPSVNTVPPMELSVPPNLQGIVTPAEFHLYITFQQQLRNDDGIRELNDKIMVHVQELQKLQLQLNVLRDKALASNPEAKAIGDRIQQALSLATKHPVAAR